MITYELEDETTKDIDGAFVRYAKFDITCKSTDEKPKKVFDGVHIKNGSTLYQMDAGVLWMYDEEDHEWCEQ